MSFGVEDGCFEEGMLSFWTLEGLDLLGVTKLSSAMRKPFSRCLSIEGMPHAETPNHEGTHD